MIFAVLATSWGSVMEAVLAKTGYLWAGLMAFITNAGILILTLLKETPLFWLDVGGYPIWLRAFVLNFYYPLLAVVVLSFLLFGVFLLMAALQRRYMEILGYVCAIAPGAALFLVSIGILIANNIANLMQGLPLHHH